MAAALGMPLMGAAQTVLADFETVQADSLGVYDYYWPASPFNTGQLAGNVKVVENPFVAFGDSTTHVLGFQRSRLAGNMYGAKIRLTTPFELTTTTKYVHVMLNRPIASGRVALIGLGKRDDRAGQSDQVVQFISVVDPTTTPNEWRDMVFAIKGNGGITISSLVVVPQAENTSEMTEDFIAYIDNIEINADPNQRYRTGDYLVNFEATDVLSRTDRKINGVAFTGNKGGKFSANVSALPSYLYQYTDSIAWAKPGETITPTISYLGNWMHGYVYLDLGQDGKFTVDTLNNKPTADSDLKAYAYLNGYNSNGTALSSGNPGINPPAFTLPENITPGIYRMRYKVDWNNADAGGNAGAVNNTKSNGGGMIDVSLNIHGETSTVTIDNRNGEVLRADSTTLSDTQVPFGQDLEILMVPAPGFKQDGIILRHGYLASDSLIHGTPQYRDEYIPSYAFVNNRYTIPARLVDGDLRITVEFAEDKATGETTGEDYTVNFDKATTEVTRTDRKTSGGGITVAGGATYSFTIDSVAPYKLYADATANKAFVAPGQTVTPFINYGGRSMHSYFYIDFDQDGQFEPQIGSSSSELVSYTYYNGTNSLGATVAADNNWTLPAFTMPDYLPEGVYRARIKLDWNDIDPGGRGDNVSNNLTKDNGGRIIDFLISVSNGITTIKTDSRNGSVYTATGTALANSVASGTTLTVKPTPVADGYTLGQIYVKSGLNLNGAAVVHGNRQWGIDTIPATALASNLAYTIPADRVDGTVVVTAHFEDDGTAGYKLMWSDEFNAADGTQPNTANWQNQPRWRSTWNRYSALSWDSVAYHQDGELVLRAIPTPAELNDTVPFITGAVRSVGRYSYKYGKLEVRAKFAPFSGNFPAIWMMPNDQSAGWPACGEIDIIEQINATNTAHQTIHTGYTSSVKRNNTPPSVFTKATDMTLYHTYGLEWTADSLRWYIDGTLTATYPRVAEYAAQGQWPFDKEFYLILNQSVGDGSWAANPTAGHTYTTKVDWIRVYQSDQQTSISSATKQSADGLAISTAPGTLTITAQSSQPVRVSDIAGRTYLTESAFSGTKTITLPTGVYIVNTTKVIVP